MKNAIPVKPIACLDEKDAHPGFAATMKKSEKVVFVTHPVN